MGPVCVSFIRVPGIKYYASSWIISQRYRAIVKRHGTGDVKQMVPHTQTAPSLANGPLAFIFKGCPERENPNWIICISIYISIIFCVCTWFYQVVFFSFLLTIFSRFSCCVLPRKCLYAWLSLLRYMFSTMLLMCVDSSVDFRWYFFV